MLRHPVKTVSTEAVVLLAHLPPITAGSGLSSNLRWFVLFDNGPPRQAYHYSRTLWGLLSPHHQQHKSLMEGLTDIHTLVMGACEAHTQMALKFIASNDHQVIGGSIHL